MSRRGLMVLLAVGTVLWIAFAVGASYLSYKHRDPVPIEQWRSQGE